MLYLKLTKSQGMETVVGQMGLLNAGGEATDEVGAEVAEGDVVEAEVFHLVSSLVYLDVE